jgi:hypothetical protein
MLKGIAALSAVSAIAPVAAVAVTHNRAVELIEAHRAAVAAEAAALAEVSRLNGVFKKQRERELFVTMPGIGLCQPWLVTRDEVWSTYAAHRPSLDRKGLNCDLLRAEAMANYDASHAAEEEIAARVGLTAAEQRQGDAWQAADDTFLALLRLSPKTPAEAGAKASYLIDHRQQHGAAWEGRHVTALIKSMVEA